MPVDIADRFAAQCRPVISTNISTCGSLTRAEVNHLTAEQLDAIFKPDGLFADLDAWFKHQIEMKACGVRRYALYDWIMANADRTLYRSAVSPGIKAVKGPSLIQPFIKGRQEGPINADHFKIVTGFACSAYTPAGPGETGPLTADDKSKAVCAGETPDRIVRVESRYGVPMDPNLFRAGNGLVMNGETIHIFNRKAGTGQSQHGQWKVIATASDADLTFVDILLRDINSGSSEPYESAPITGVVIPGVNNVMNWEKWCQNSTTLNTRKMVLFWKQTFRNTRCVDSEYREVFARLRESNAAFAEFENLDLAEHNRQSEMRWMRNFVNDFLYNKGLVNQTKDLWEGLESVYTVSGSVLDPGLSGKLMGKRANFIGVREQLRTCDRLFDLFNNPINLTEFLNLNFDIMRSRKSGNAGSSRKVTDIDWFTDTDTRSLFLQAFMAYYKANYGDAFRATYDLAKLNSLEMPYDSYYVLKPAGVRINILTDEYFDDRLSEFVDQSIDSAGRLLLCLDIGKPGPTGGSIYWAQLAANRKSYNTAKIEELAKYDATFRCVMETVSIEQTLTSEEGTAVVECPLHSAWIENFSGAAIVTTGVSENPYITNIY